MIGGGICIAGAALFAKKLGALRQAVRPIYAQLGIVPELATGLQAASAVDETVQD
jgi:hypothetical protein